jgi:hypothetical protein
MAVTARRIYLRFVPKKDRETVRGLGARYDRDMRRWFAPHYVDPAVFAAWLPAPAANERGDGTHSTASANLVVPKVIAYEDPINRTTWKTRRVR